MRGDDLPHALALLGAEAQPLGRSRVGHVRRKPWIRIHRAIPLGIFVKRLFLAQFRLLLGRQDGQHLLDLFPRNAAKPAFFFFLELKFQGSQLVLLVLGHAEPPQNLRLKHRSAAKREGAEGQVLQRPQLLGREYLFDLCAGAAPLLLQFLDCLFGKRQTVPEMV
jgi:hypothetical protein